MTPPDVSRVEYDAALKRVRGTRSCVYPCHPLHGCLCRRTEDEAPVRYTPAEHAEHFGYPLVVPPTEPPMRQADGVEVIPAKPVTTLVDRLDPEGRTMIRDGEDYAADRRAEMNRQTFGSGVVGPWTTQETP